jgi:hypothetical protein
MDHAAKNAPLFIEAFYDAYEALHPSGIGLPDLNRVNRVLLENDAGYEISPPDLVPRNPNLQITLPKHTPSLDEQAQELIQRSLDDSENFFWEVVVVQLFKKFCGFLKPFRLPFGGSTLKRARYKESISTRSLPSC